MDFDKYADNYDTGFMGKGSGRFYADLIKEIEVKDKRLLCDRPVYRCGNVSCIPERKIHDVVYNCADNNDRRDCPDRQRYIDT